MEPTQDRLRELGLQPMPCPPGTRYEQVPVTRPALMGACQECGQDAELHTWGRAGGPLRLLCASCKLAAKRER